MSAEDRAQEREAAEWERNNQPRPGLVVYQPHDPLYGPAECVECDAQLPTVRRAYGFKMCVGCTEKAERLVRFLAGG